MLGTQSLQVPRLGGKATARPWHKLCRAHATAAYTELDLASGAVPVLELPCIDVSAAVRGEAPSHRTARQLAEACESTGFFAVTGHGCCMATVASCMHAAQPFFDSPLAYKEQHIVDGMRAGRGYEVSPEHAAYEAHVRAVAAGDAQLRRRLQSHAEASVGHARMAERFMCGGAGAEAGNVWPVEHPQLQRSMALAYADCATLAAAVLRVAARALCEDASFFEPSIDRHESNMQVANYASLLVPPPAGVLRKKAHVDSGTLTVLATDDWTSGTWQPGHGGLQLLRRDGVWAEVAVPRGALLVNLGSLLTRWTNGRWASTLHRVACPPRALLPAPRRISLAFFHKPNADAAIAPVASCVDAAHPPAFEARTAAELTRRGILARHAHLTREEASAAYHAELAAVRRAHETYWH